MKQFVTVTYWFVDNLFLYLQNDCSNNLFVETNRPAQS
jgi:hypothetical protein